MMYLVSEPALTSLRFGQKLSVNEVKQYEEEFGADSFEVVEYDAKMAAYLSEKDKYETFRLMPKDELLADFCAWLDKLSVKA